MLASVNNDTISHVNIAQGDRRVSAYKFGGGIDCYFPALSARELDSDGVVRDSSDGSENVLHASVGERRGNHD
jgi:hypothetical protein